MFELDLKASRLDVGVGGAEGTLLRQGNSCGRALSSSTM